MHRPVLGAMFLCLVFGCAKKSSSDETSPPSEAGAASGADDLAALEQQLALRESELQAIGVAPQTRSNNMSADAAGGDGVGPKAAGEAGATADTTAPTPPGEPAPSSAQRPAAKIAAPTDDEGNRCERVCEISAAICALEDQICGLLPRHQGEARYQAACDRSVADCQLATEACNACTAN